MKRTFKVLALTVVLLFGGGVAAADDAAAGPVNHFCC